MSGESELEQERAEERHLERIHKAAPDKRPGWQANPHCNACNQRIKLVPGGSGPVWVHADSGAVAAPNPVQDSAISDIITKLLTDPARYVACAGTYADGYLDALLDVLTGLGQLRPPASYQALRMQIIQKQLKGG